MKWFLSVEGRLATDLGGSGASPTARSGGVGCPRDRIRRSAGFTLLELMVVVAIVAILAAIAYPSYTSYIIKSRRTAAKACLSEYANYMERYYTTNLRYDQNAAATANTLPATDCASAQQTGPNYAYTLGTLATSTYVITATPQGPQVADTQCGALTLDQSGARGAASSGCW